MSTFVFAPSWISYPNRPKRTDDFSNLKRDPAQLNKDISPAKNEHYPPLIAESTKPNNSNSNNTTVWSNPKLILRIHSPAETNDEADVAETAAKTELERLKALVPKTTKTKSSATTKRRPLSASSSSTSLAVATTTAKTTFTESKQLKQKTRTNTVHTNKSLTDTATTAAIVTNKNTDTRPLTKASIGNRRGYQSTQHIVAVKESVKKNEPLQRHCHDHLKQNANCLQPRASNVSNSLKSKESSIEEEEYKADTIPKCTMKTTTPKTQSLYLREKLDTNMTRKENVVADVISKEEQQRFMYFIKSWTSYGTCTSPSSDEEEEVFSTRQQYYNHFHFYEADTDELQAKSSNDSVSSSNSSHAITTPQQAKLPEHYFNVSPKQSSSIDTNIGSSYFYYNPFC